MPSLALDSLGGPHLGDNVCIETESDQCVAWEQRYATRFDGELVSLGVGQPVGSIGARGALDREGGAHTLLWNRELEMLQHVVAPRCGAVDQDDDGADG